MYLMGSPSTKAMSTLYRTAYYVDMKTTPAWYEQKRPRTGTSRSQSPTDRTGVVGPRGLGAENTIYASIWLPPRIFRGQTMNLIFFFDVRSFTSLIQNCKFRKSLEIVEMQRNALCKSGHVKTWTTDHADCADHADWEFFFFFFLLTIFQFLLPWFSEGVFIYTFYFFAMSIDSWKPGMVLEK